MGEIIREPIEKMTCPHASNVHLGQEVNLAPGLYPTDPQGHTLVVGQTTGYGDVRSFSALNMGGAITIAGVEVTDPDLLDQLADRLRTNAASLRHQQAHPYHPGLPDIEGCTECGLRRPNHYRPKDVTNE